MAYYTRILSKSEIDIDLSAIQEALSGDGLIANFELDLEESNEDWTVLGVSNSKGEDIIQIEKNFAIEGELGFDELEEFREEIYYCKPNSAVKWLNKYFDEVEIIYAFQMLDGCYSDSNFPIVNKIKEVIWNVAGGIFQADNEGFSNEDGYHILWQFADDVSGEWSMAVQNFFGKWKNFIMDLEDQNQRSQFWAGKVPTGARKV